MSKKPENSFIFVKYKENTSLYRMECSCGHSTEIPILPTNIDESIFKCEKCDLITKLNLHVPFKTGEEIAPGVYVSWVDVYENAYKFSKVIGLRETADEDEEEVLLKDRENENYTYVNNVQSINSMDKTDIIENNKYINFVVAYSKEGAIMCMDDQITCSEDLQLSLFNMIKYYHVLADNYDDNRIEEMNISPEELDELEELEQEELSELSNPVNKANSIITYGDNIINPEFFKLRVRLLKVGFDVKNNIFLSVYSIKNRKSALFSISSCLGVRSFQSHFCTDNGAVSSYVLREYDSVIESIFVSTDLCKSNNINLEKIIMTSPVVSEIKATTQGHFLEIQLDQSPGSWDYVRELVLFMQNLSKNKGRSNIIVLPERTTRGKNIFVNKEPEFLFKELSAS